MSPERQRKPSAKARNVVSIDREKSLIWNGPEYPVLSPGIYTVGAINYQGPEWVRSYRRWSLRLEFGLVSESISVSAFYNLGSNPAAPHVGRQSRYYKAWVLANGDSPTHKQLMTPEVFLEGQLFEVEVADCDRDYEGNPKSKGEVYSRIVRIISVTRP